MTRASPWRARAAHARLAPGKCLVLENAEFAWRSAAVKELHRKSWGLAGSRPLRSVTERDDCGRRNGSLGRKLNQRLNLFSVVDQGRLFRFRDCLANSLLAQSAHATWDPYAHPMAV